MININGIHYPRAPGQKFSTLFFIALMLITLITVISYAEPSEPSQDEHTPSTLPYAGLPQVTLQISDLDDSGDLIYIGIDFAVFEEVDTASGDPEDIDGDGKVFKAKEGKVKRFLINSTNITIDLGQPQEYKKAVRHKLAMRTLYTPTGAGAGEIIIANQSNGKDGWVEIPDSEFILSYFAPINADNPIIKHTDKWEENRNIYNESKIAAGIAALMTEMRPQNIFWSGEKLLIEVKTSEQPEAVRVSLFETTEAGIGALYTKTLLAGEILTDSYATDGAIYGDNATGGAIYGDNATGGAIYDDNATGGAIYGDNATGVVYKDEIWDKFMMNKWGNHTPKVLIVELSAIISGVAVETQYSNIVMDNKEQFYRIKRVF